LQTRPITDYDVTHTKAKARGDTNAAPAIIDLSIDSEPLAELGDPVPKKLALVEVEEFMLEQIEENNIPFFTDTTKAEIDALEALHPGKLEEILGERIKELQDPDLAAEVEEAKEEAERAVREEAEEVMEAHKERREEIEEAQAIINRYRVYYRKLGEKMEARYRRLGERYERHIAELRSEVAQLHEAVEKGLEELEVALPEMPEPEVEETEEWLFDSRRDFMDQTRRFRQRKGLE
jgi:chromosome segregation ATPase